MNTLESLRLLRTTVIGAVDAIKEMTSSERATRPTSAYGDDYNRIRDDVSEMLPEVRRFLPAAAELVADPAEGRSCRQSFAEFLSNYNMILNLLSRRINDMQEPPRVERG